MKVGEYAYDAWGNCTVQTNVDGMADLNPFRYRGYYCDSETGFYYLQSRYYEPELRRFLSSDSYDLIPTFAEDGDLNLYAYCGNNPVMFVDPSGHMPEWLQWTLGGLAFGGLVVATVLTCGVAGAGAAAVGAAMLTGGLVSAGVNVIDQLHDGGGNLIGLN